VRLENRRRIEDLLANHVFGIVISTLLALKALDTSFALLELFVIGAFLLEETLQG